MLGFFEHKGDQEDVFVCGSWKRGGIYALFSNATVYIGFVEEDKKATLTCVQNKSVLL